MTISIWYALTGITLAFVGVYGMLASPHVFRKILAFNLAGSGVFLALVAIAHRGPDLPPDPVPHAMVLTGIVVAVSATALALAIARRVSPELRIDPVDQDAYDRS